MRVVCRMTLVVALALIATTRDATGQSVATSQNLETSVRVAGMGGATTGVGWGEPGAWGNPAALAQTSGLAWLMGNTNLGPGLSGDVTFESRRMLLGGEGIGVSLMGKPISGFGGARLEFGSEGTDPFGNPVGYDLHEQVDSWGFGVSPVQVMDFFRARKSPESRSWASRADVSFGYQQKETELHLQPFIQNATASNSDWGVMGVLAILPGVVEGHEARLELGAGYAVLNADGQSTFDLGFDQAPSSKMKRTGFSAHATIPFGGAHDEEAGSGWGWWSATVPRTVELGFAYDHSSITDGDSEFSESAENLGFEARLMGILAGRTGYADVPGSFDDGWSFGFGVHVPIGTWAGLGYDWAKVPSPEGVDNIYRHGFALWLHPVVFWKSTHE